MQTSVQSPQSGQRAAGRRLSREKRAIEAVEGPQGTEGPAPEAPVKAFRGHHQGKERQGEKRQQVDQGPEGQHRGLEELIQGFAHVGEGRPQAVQGQPGLFHPVAEGGVKDDGQGAVEQGQGVEKPHQVQGKEAAHQQSDEQVVLAPAPPGRHAAIRARGKEQPAGPVQGGSQGADPAAEKPAQDEGQGHHDQGPEQPGHQGAEGQELGRQDQGVEAKEQVHRPGQVFLPREFGFQKQPEKQGQKEDLDDPAEAGVAAAG